MLKRIPEISQTLQGKFHPIGVKQIKLASNGSLCPAGIGQSDRSQVRLNYVRSYNSVKFPCRTLFYFLWHYSTARIFNSPDSIFNRALSTFFSKVEQSSTPPHLCLMPNATALAGRRGISLRLAFERIRSWQRLKRLLGVVPYPNVNSTHPLRRKILPSSCWDSEFLMFFCLLFAGAQV